MVLGQYRYVEADLVGPRAHVQARSVQLSVGRCSEGRNAQIESNPQHCHRESSGSATTRGLYVPCVGPVNRRVEDVPIDAPFARLQGAAGVGSVPPMLFSPLLVVLLLVAVALVSGVKILNEYERGVVFRLGRLVNTRGPGLIYVIPIIEEMYRLDLRTVALDVPPQDVITRDNVSVQVNAVLYFRVVDANRAVVDVQNYLYATSQIAQTTLRSVCGQAQLDELLTEREHFNTRLQEIIDSNTEPWGVKVTSVEVKHIDLPVEMQRSLARQAEAERLRRAKVINAEGEFQAAMRLSEAASVMETSPASMQLRMLQAFSQIGKEKNQTLIVPLPIDLIRSVLGDPARKSA